MICTVDITIGIIIQLFIGDAGIVVDTEAGEVQEQCAAAWATILASLRSLNVNVPADPAMGATLDDQIRNERNRISQRVNNGLSGLGLAYADGYAQTHGESNDTQESCYCIGPRPIDGSLVLTMERTLYAALNQAWLVVISGVGFMSIGARGDNFPNFLGFMLILAGALFAVGSYIVHVRRLRAFTRNEPIGSLTSVLFTGTLVGTIFVSLMFELYYSVLYPFLDRAAAVSITNLGITNTTLD